MTKQKYSCSLGKLKYQWWPSWMKILTDGISCDGCNILRPAVTAKDECFSRVQPQAVMQSLFTSTKHFINPFTISIKMKSWCVPNVLCCLWTFINISIYKGKFGKLVTDLAECRKYLAANTAPWNERSISLSNWSSRNATSISSSDLILSPAHQQTQKKKPKCCTPLSYRVNIENGTTITELLLNIMSRRITNKD